MKVILFTTITYYQLILLPGQRRKTRRYCKNKMIKSETKCRYLHILRMSCQVKEKADQLQIRQTCLLGPPESNHDLKSCQQQQVAL